MGHLHRLARMQGLTSDAPGQAALALPAAPRPWRRALAWLAFLGPFFFASYGFANWVAGSRAGVGTVVFDWERHIPFLPWTILPYWVIDLFYAGSMFVFASRGALDVHARRLLAAQLLAVICFLAYPLRFSFERAEPDGLFGSLFAALSSFDQPFNQAPSLHIALLVILWLAYRPVLPIPIRCGLDALFVLIGVSVLTTYQHHFIDIPTGLWLGWLCVWLFPHESSSPIATARVSRDPMRRAVALRYAGAAALLAGLLLWAGGIWLWLLWGCGSLLLVGLVYAMGHAGGFQKRSDGRLSLAVRWLFAPYTLGAWLNSRWWTRSQPGMDRIAPGLFVGRVPSGREPELATIAAIVDVAAELPCAARVARYASIPMLDLVAPDAAQIEQAVRSIEALHAAGAVLVCCALGYSRSATVAAAWLVRSGRAGSPDEAVTLVRAARNGIVLGADHLAALRAWHRQYCA